MAGRERINGSEGKKSASFREFKLDWNENNYSLMIFKSLKSASGGGKVLYIKALGWAIKIVMLLCTLCNFNLFQRFEEKLISGNLKKRTSRCPS